MICVGLNTKMFTFVIMKLFYNNTHQYINMSVLAWNGMHLDWILRGESIRKGRKWQGCLLDMLRHMETWRSLIHIQFLFRWFFLFVHVYVLHIRVAGAQVVSFTLPWSLAELDAAKFFFLFKFSLRMYLLF